MEKVMKKLMLLLSAILCLTVASCSNDTEETDGDEVVQITYAPKKIVLSAKQQENVEVTNQFSLNIFKALSETENYKGESIFTSPLSAAFVTAMLLNGASGETATEIARVYGFDSADKSVVDAVNNMAQKLVAELPTLDDYTSFSLGSLVVNYRKDSVLPSFASTMRSCFDIEVEEYDQSAKRDSVLKQMSAWRETHDLDNEDDFVTYYETLLNLPSMDFNIMNSLCFEGKWLQPFEKSSTKERMFYTEYGGSIKKMAMRQKNYFNCNDNDIYQTLQMMYGNGSYSMLIMLPHSGKKVDDIISSLTPTSWKENISELTSHCVDVQIPKFACSNIISFCDALKSLGIKSLFEKTADMSNMYGSWKGYEHSERFDLLQDANMELDEGGTKATVKTKYNNGYILIDGSPQVTEFIADHPFVYAIVENSTGAICFMGKYMGK